MHVPRLRWRFWIGVALITIVGSMALISALARRMFSTNSDAIDTIYTGKTVDAGAFSTSQQFIALGRMMGNASDNAPYEISLWSVQNKRFLWSNRTDSALSLAFSPDSETLASDSHKGITLWRVKDGVRLRTLDSGEPEGTTIANKQVFQVSFSHDGGTIAATGPFKMWLWKMPEGVLLKTIDLSGCGISNSLSFSPDDRTLAIGCGEFNRAEKPDRSHYPILLWNVSTGTLMRRLEGHVTEVSALDFSPDGEVLTSGGGRSDGELRLWRVSNGSLLSAKKLAISISERISGYYSSIYTVAFSPDGQVVAYSGSDKKIYLMKVADRQVLKSLNGDGSSILKIAFSPDGGRLSSISARGAIQTWNAK